MSKVEGVKMKEQGSKRVRNPYAPAIVEKGMGRTRVVPNKKRKKKGGRSGDKRRVISHERSLGA